MKDFKINKLLCCAGLFLIFNSTGFSQQQPVGIFDGQVNIGAIALAGTAMFNTNNHEYRMEGYGTGACGEKDEFNFIWKRIKGDFILYARGRFAEKNEGHNGKFGWMVRQSLESSSPQVSAVVKGDKFTSLEYRKNAGETASEIVDKLAHADVIQLQRTDTTYTMRVARFGQPFITQQITGLDLGEEVYIGLFVCSPDKNVMEKGLFWDVQITIPVDEELAFIRSDIGSNIEIMDIETGKRNIINTDSNSTNSPIWTKDGKKIIYSKQGLMYSLNLANYTSQKLYTGDSITRNTNDHVLSVDGKTIAFSNVKSEQGGALIYTIPVTGGIPKRISRRGPVYPHGWSPGGKSILFSGAHNGDFDVYKVPSVGGKEIRLTNSKGIDDAPESTPDGKYIYFNSNRTGTMLIWRMKPDGSKQQAVTNGEFHDWFPHISPDGKWVVFLSYSKEDASPNGKPPYKHVYLRLMPIAGGKPKIIAYIYGGQGSINSPCWSPDSKRIAFTSYTDIAQ